TIIVQLSLTFVPYRNGRRLAHRDVVTLWREIVVYLFSIGGFSMLTTNSLPLPSSAPPTALSPSCATRRRFRSASAFSPLTISFLSLTTSSLPPAPASAIRTPPSLCLTSKWLQKPLQKNAPMQIGLQM